MLGVGLTTVDEWYEKWVGGALAPGAIAAITYARKLMMLPVGVVGQAVGAALLPSLTALSQRGDRAGFDALLTGTLRTTLGLGLIAGGALAALAKPIVALVFEHGRFDAANTREVAGLLVVLAFAVPGWVVQQVAVRGFYARSEMGRAMVLSSAIAVAVFPLYLIGGRWQGVTGLALASLAAVSLNAVATIVWLRRRAGSPDALALLGGLVRTLALVALAGGLAHLALRASPRPDSALLELVVGGGVYGVAIGIGVFTLGDAPLRAALAQILARLTRRAGRPRAS